MKAPCPNCSRTINTETNVTGCCIECGFRWKAAPLTKVDMIHKLGLSNKTFDYALPQPWVDRVYEETGIVPVPHFVWLYDEKAKIFGRPYALTATGWVVLKMLEKEVKLNDHI